MSIEREAISPDRETVLAIARAERHSTKASISSLTLAAHVLETIGDNHDLAAAHGIRDALANLSPTMLPTKAQQLATSITNESNAERMVQHFTQMNARRRPGMIRSFLSAIGITALALCVVHVAIADPLGRTFYTIERASIEYCGQC